MTLNLKTTPVYKVNVKDLINQLGNMIPEKQLAVFNNDVEQLADKYTSPLKLKKGEKAPLFSLPNAEDNTVNLEELLQHGPVVLIFYRGIWCPYCNLQLSNYQQILPQIKEAGATLVAVSPMTPDNSLSLVEKDRLQFEVLSDVGNKVARQFTTVFKNDNATIQAMQELGYDFRGFYGDDSDELPVPATFVIAQDRILLFASSGGGDYRERVEPQEILDVLSP